MNAQRIDQDLLHSRAAALRRLDRNGDGSLEPFEILPDRIVWQAAMILMRLDRNGDGVISGAELDGARELFEGADTNHDGVITREDLELRLRAERARELERGGE